MGRTAKKIDTLFGSPLFLFPLLFWQTSLISAPLSCVFSLMELLSLSLSLCLITKLSDSFWMSNDVFHPCLIQLLCIMALKISLQIFKKILFNALESYHVLWSSMQQLPRMEPLYATGETPRSLCQESSHKNMVWLQEQNVICWGSVPFIQRFPKF